MKNYFNDPKPGDKTSWVIEFSKEKQETNKKPAFFFYTPSSPGKDNMVDINALEKVQEDYTKFLEAITKLCTILEKGCQENIKEIQMAQEDVKSLDSTISTLGDIIRKFNEILNRFRKRKDPPG